MKNTYTPLHNNVILEHIQTADKYVMSNGEELYIDISYDLYKHTNQDAIIMYPPKKLTGKLKGHDVKIKTGDKVHCHHFVVDPDRYHEQDGKKYIELNYELIYCIDKEGDLEMLLDYILLEPVYEDESTCMSGGLWLKDKPDLKPQYGKVAFLNQRAKDYGLQKGDLVYFKRFRDYKMNINSKDYYRMDFTDIICKF